MSVEAGDYGYVIVTTGAHEGKVGYYDDEGDDEDDCVIYFGDVVDGYVIINRDHLRPATELEAARAEKSCKRKWLKGV